MTKELLILLVVLPLALPGISRADTSDSSSAGATVPSGSTTTTDNSGITPGGVQDNHSPYAKGTINNPPVDLPSDPLRPGVLQPPANHSTNPANAGAVESTGGTSAGGTSTGQ